MIRLTTLVAAAFVLAACSEQPQGTTARKVDDKPWETASTPYAAPGFQAGNKDAWERQLKARTAGQNEYTRTTAQ